ncbi:gamma-glutamyltransferase [Chitinophaga parva]|uniref:Glutathione hydrolase proenzyme n=1 Tax=Chitinophaga parva TaxID=2169414 RepID=A0A2T7BCQ3_9BACT|nr:gamma-glutamyltransferase [Chitinophaga parva]PUZ22857.1 gamma-glutamyltransferase [Chitinophaga parva]
MIRTTYCLLTTLLCASTTLAQSTNPFHYTLQKQITAQKAAVVCAHPLAASAGLRILRQGGNAIDAAIATQLALAVVYPAAGNIGGGGFLVAHLNTPVPEKKGRPSRRSTLTNISIDYREAAPSKASRDMYLDSAGNAISTLSLYGGMASGVPGTVAGLFAAHRYGKLPFATLIAPAIELAEKGFAITELEARDLNAAAKDFRRLNPYPTAFTKNTPWKAGDTLIQKDLAHTLRLIRDKGTAGFYEGETAQRLVATMQKGNGIISLADLKQYKAVERAPVMFNYHGYTILTMPLPSSGGIGIQQMLGMVEKYPLSAWGFQSLKSTQLMIEAERRAYADRAEFLGDPDFVQVPVAQLTSPAYLASRMQDYDSTKAGNSQLVKAGAPGHESMQTTHLCVMDAHGNAVSVTTTLNNGYGSRVVVEGAGFFLNDEMDDFSAKPGTPNMFGLVGTAANAIAPRKRMLSSMTPTIVLKNDQPYLVTGTPGGSTIITSVFQTIVNVLDFHLPLDKAVNAPKFHHQWLPDEVDLEKGFPDSTRLALKAMGYHLLPISQIGRTEAILANADGTLTAVGDHRGDDAAAGY